MEDSEAFNAGRGSKLTVFGHVEMDASIMEASTMQAGAVASVGGIRHPVQLAKGVMENTSHVLVVGSGALKSSLINLLKKLKRIRHPVQLARGVMENTSHV